MRFLLTIPIVVALLGPLAACGDRAPILPPPRVVRLDCKPETPGREMIFSLDTGLQTATWETAASALKGSLAISNREYRISMPSSASAPASTVTINRYDGVMARVVRSGTPFRTEAWRCASHKPGPSL